MLLALVLDIKVVVVWSEAVVADVVGVLVALLLEVKVVVVWSVVDVAYVVLVPVAVVLEVKVMAVVVICPFECKYSKRVSI